MIRIYCDVCRKVPQPEVNARQTSVSITVDNVEFTVRFSADIDLCHECRNAALGKMMEYLHA